MADRKISELSSNSLLTGAELIPLVQYGETKKAALSELSGLPIHAVSSGLHRSPNAITALFVYDTSKDSDAGAWTEKCQHTSWYQETIYGKWLGAQTSESAARAVSGATTDDYYQLTTDGKFYKLNATSGVTEVFRGNKRAFPKLAAIVAEAASVTVYDLTEPGRTMWMRFTQGANNWLFSAASTVAAGNGVVVVGGSTGCCRFSFAADKGEIRTASGTSALRGYASNRNAGLSFSFLGAGGAIANHNVNAVALTVLSDAPMDPATGLKVPTIAVATGGGLSLIQNTGTVRNSSSTLAFTQVTLTPQLLSAGRADAVWYYAANPGSLGASFALSTKNASTATDFNVGNTTLLKAKDRANYARTSGAVVQILRNNESTIGNGIAAKLSDTYNTGWLVGDIRRAYLASNAAGSVGPATELVTNGTFDTDVSGWEAAFISQGSSISAVGGKLAIVGRGAKTSLGSGFTPGKTYRFTFYQEPATPSLHAYCLVGIGYSENGTAILSSGVFRYSSEPANTYNFYVTIPANYAGQTLVVTFSVLDRAGVLSAYTTNIDNVSFIEVIPDRSYKAAASTINGTLTATAVNTGNDLVAYSGFSGSNYIQEPYSTDLDFGTGEWSCSAWVNVPTANAAAGTAASRAYSSGPYITLGIDATNKLTATAYDGTTTRTVTTTAAYNTATWLKVRANYTTNGTLAILVNGVNVATTTGTPLLTLNNANAVLTIGNSYALDAPFPGSIALLKLSASVPTSEQALFMYEQEKHLFNAGAKCVLPASTNVLDLAYDDATDTWSTLQATHEASWSGLIRTSTQTPSAGSFSRTAEASGVQLLGRTTTNPGVDVRMPAKNLRPKDMPRDTNQDIVVFDFDAVTSQTDFVLPVGYTARVVYSAGAQKRLGSTKDYTVLFDGFRETVRFGTAPGNGVWVQIHAAKEVA